MYVRLLRYVILIVPVQDKLLRIKEQERKTITTTKINNKKTECAILSVFLDHVTDQVFICQPFPQLFIKESSFIFNFYVWCILITKELVITPKARLSDELVSVSGNFQCRQLAQSPNVSVFLTSAATWHTCIITMLIIFLVFYTSWHRVHRP